MRRSVHQQLELALEAYRVTPREEWVQQWPGQVAIGVGQTYWTTGVHEAIKTGATGLQAYFEQLDSDLKNIVALVG